MLQMDEVISEMSHLKLHFDCNRECCYFQFLKRHTEVKKNS